LGHLERLLNFEDRLVIEAIIDRLATLTLIAGEEAGLAQVEVCIDRHIKVWCICFICTIRSDVCPDVRVDLARTKLGGACASVFDLLLFVYLIQLLLQKVKQRWRLDNLVS
jgi:hypothetical protein